MSPIDVTINEAPFFEEVDAEIVVISGCALGFVSKSYPPHVLHIEDGSVLDVSGIEMDDILLRVQNKDIANPFLGKKKIMQLLTESLPLHLTFVKPADAPKYLGTSLHVSQSAQQQQQACQSLNSVNSVHSNISVNEAPMMPPTKKRKKKDRDRDERKKDMRQQQGYPDPRQLDHRDARYQEHQDQRSQQQDSRFQDHQQHQDLGPFGATAGGFGTSSGSDSRPSKPVGGVRDKWTTKAGSDGEDEEPPMQTSVSLGGTVNVNGGSAAGGISLAPNANWRAGVPSNPTMLANSPPNTNNTQTAGESGMTVGKSGTWVPPGTVVEVDKNADTQKGVGGNQKGGHHDGHNKGGQNKGGHHDGLTVLLRDLPTEMRTVIALSAPLQELGISDVKNMRQLPIESSFAITFGTQESAQSCINQINSRGLGGHRTVTARFFYRNKNKGEDWKSKGGKGEDGGGKWHWEAPAWAEGNKTWVAGGKKEDGGIKRSSSHTTAPLVHKPIAPVHENKTLETGALADKKFQKHKVEAKKKGLMEHVTEKIKQVLARMNDPEISADQKAKYQKILTGMRQKLSSLADLGKERKLPDTYHEVKVHLIAPNIHDTFPVETTTLETLQHGYDPLELLKDILQHQHPSMASLPPSLDDTPNTPLDPALLTPAPPGQPLESGNFLQATWDPLSPIATWIESPDLASVHIRTGANLPHEHSVRLPCISLKFKDKAAATVAVEALTAASPYITATNMVESTQNTHDANGKGYDVGKGNDTRKGYDASSGKGGYDASKGHDPSGKGGYDHSKGYDASKGYDPTGKGYDPTGGKGYGKGDAYGKGYWGKGNMKLNLAGEPAEVPEAQYEASGSPKQMAVGSPKSRVLQSPTGSPRVPGAVPLADGTMQALQ